MFGCEIDCGRRDIELERVERLGIIMNVLSPESSKVDQRGSFAVQKIRRQDSLVISLTRRDKTPTDHWQ